MKIIGIHFYQYQLALNRPLAIRGKTLNQREGIIIKLSSDTGHEGLGEVAPLPGFSLEQLEDALKQLQRVKPALIEAIIPPGVEHLDGRFFNWLHGYKLYPSVQFGIEAAVLNLIAHSKRVPLYQLLSSHNHTHIRLSALLQNSGQEAIYEAKQLVEQGFIGLKLKVGKNKLDDDIKTVLAINKEIEGKAVLHVDANQAWSYEQALEFGSEVGAAALDYIEEPFSDTARISEFFDQTMIPVALDESLMKLSFDEVKSLNGVFTIILKPTILGGIEKIWQMSKEGKKLALDSVISSSFESGLGIAILAYLSGTTSRDQVAGLDTLKWFKDDVLKTPLELHKGKIDLHPKVVQSSDLNFDLLKSV